ncbi:hypothetical protein SKAU_G00402610 [Synaphobranchus kaupii]|uniref:Uncharacterized protein n=1 Tax=Synaphobranchus kaupii TaxID=118154 RepID=A0A9Q1ICJ0_SYNKA|nr:hypothetical protein SKAU_G00402610 [Synaphobranchus kaupii]
MAGPAPKGLARRVITGNGNKNQCRFPRNTAEKENNTTVDLSFLWEARQPDRPSCFTQRRSGRHLYEASQIKPKRKSEEKREGEKLSCDEDVRVEEGLTSFLFFFFSLLDHLNRAVAPDAFPIDGGGQLGVTLCGTNVSVA